MSDADRPLRPTLDHTDPKLHRTAVPARAFLTRSALAELDQAFLESLDHTLGLRRRHPEVGRHLLLPRVPTALSEGIAASVVPTIFGSRARPVRPGNLIDLGVDAPGQARALVAVKGTGPARWITFTETDCRANQLLWVDYSSRIEHRVDEVDVWLFDTRGWRGPRRLTYRQAFKLGREPIHFHFAPARKTDPPAPKGP